MKTNTAWAWLALAGVWVVALAVGIAMRPVMPVDETRYLSVAWNMWREHQFLVPLLNGEPYPDKPPLLFWLIQAGWAVGGVSEIWARTAAPLAGLAATLLTARLGRELWPERPSLGLFAAMLLMGSGFWLIFATLTMFDMLVVATTVVAVTAIVRAARTGGWRGWAVAAIAGGIGVLSKGPVGLLPIASIALLAPLWRRRPPGRGWAYWYMATVAMLATAGAVGLAWALPAAYAGGEAFARHILWDQTTGRIVNAFAHARPIWWYLPLLPALTLPWLLWTPLWRGARAACRTTDEGVRLCFVWVLAVVITMSLISGKQPHYMLPIFPALALLGARALDAAGAVGRRDRLPLAIFWGVLGIASFAVPMAAARGLLPGGFAALPPSIGIVLLTLAVAIAGPVRLSAGAGVAVLMASVLVAVVLVNFGFHETIGPNYDTSAIARRIGDFQRASRPVALVERQGGQFDFVGRLPKPLPVISRQRIEAWSRAHPQGYLVRQQKDMPVGGDYVALHRFRGQYLVIWPAPALANRVTKSSE